MLLSGPSWLTTPRPVRLSYMLSGPTLVEWVWLLLVPLCFSLWPDQGLPGYAMGSCPPTRGAWFCRSSHTIGRRDEPRLADGFQPFIVKNGGIAGRQPTMMAMWHSRRAKTMIGIASSGKASVSTSSRLDTRGAGLTSCVRRAGSWDVDGTKDGAERSEEAQRHEPADHDLLGEADLNFRHEVYGQECKREIHQSRQSSLGNRLILLVGCIPAIALFDDNPGLGRWPTPQQWHYGRGQIDEYVQPDDHIDGDAPRLVGSEEAEEEDADGQTSKQHTEEARDFADILKLENVEGLAEIEATEVLPEAVSRGSKSESLWNRGEHLRAGSLELTQGGDEQSDSPKRSPSSSHPTHTLS